MATNRLEELATDADLYLVSVSDSALTSLLPAITAVNPKGLFVHTAGSVPMAVWEGLATRYGVLYPMQTFSKERDVDFHQVSFFIEAAGRKTHTCCGNSRQASAPMSTKRLPNNADTFTSELYLPAISPITCMPYAKNCSNATDFLFRPCCH